MLIQTAIEVLTPQLVALGWVENYGGVVQRIALPTQNNSDGIKYKNIPVACGVSFDDCNKNQRYTALSPDNKKKSVLYWEVLQGLSDRGADGQQRQRRVLQGRARLVGWLNAGKLGKTQCNTAADAIRSIIPILYQDFKSVSLPAIFQNSRVEFKVIGEQPKSAAIFSPYDYDKNIDGLLMYPYDYFALDVEITVFLSLCDYSFTPDTPIDCVDYSQP